MRSTSDLVDWFSTHEESIREQQRKSSNDEVSKTLISFLWPAGLHYFSPLNALFLIQFSHLQALRMPVCLARDGLVPLLWLFRQNPPPEESLRKLLVHEEMSPYVPSAWRKQTGAYRISSAPRVRKGSSPRRLLLTGILLEAYCDIASLEKILDRACRELDLSRKKLEEVVAFLPPRLDGFGVEHDHSFPIEYTSVLGRFFGGKVTGLKWSGFDAASSWAGYGVCDLNSKLVCADSYLVHRALSLGGRLVGEKAGPAPKGKLGWIDLSPNHGMQITLQLEGECAIERSSKLPAEMTGQFEKRFMEAMRSDANRRFPWPIWFAHWARHLMQSGREPVLKKKSRT